MKKLLCALLALIAVAGSYADMPNRKFEMGSDAYLGFANNEFGVGDIFKKTVVIDFNKIVDDIGDNGLKFNADFGYNSFINLNFPETIRGGLFFNVDSSSYSCVPTSLFELVASGNELDRQYKDSFDVRTDVTAELGGYYTRKIGPVLATFRPAYFMPLLYIDDSSIEYSLKMEKLGKTTITGKTNVSVYTPFSTKDLEKGVSAADILGGAFTSGGLDLGLGAEYPLMSALTLGATLKSVPIVPARLGYSSTYSSNLTMNVDNLLMNYNDKPIATSTDSSAVYTDDGTEYVLRPFKFGVNAAYKPFASGIIAVMPDVALAVRKGVYVDFGLKGRLNLKNVWILTLGTGIEDLVWRQSVTSTLNLRIVQFDLSVGSQSQDFLKSFQGAGLYISLGSRIGY